MILTLNANGAPATTGGYALGTPTAATGTILDDDTTVTVGVSPASVAEDGAGTLVYTFTRNSLAAGALTVNFTASGGASLTGDYTQTGAATFDTGTGLGTVSFSATDLTATVTLSPTDDTTVENDETAVLTVNAGGGYVVGAPGAATGTITNDDTDLSVAVAPSSVFEDGAGNLVYTFTRNGVTSSSLVVNFTVGGTAGLTGDYALTGATSFDTFTGVSSVTFAPGSSTAQVTVDPTVDGTVEGDETVSFGLNAGAGYNVVAGQSIAGGTINNDDASISISLNPPTSVAEDGAPVLTYTFTRSGYTANTLPVSFTASGSATKDVDYAVTVGATFVGPVGTVTFAPGATMATVVADPTPDLAGEPDETVIFTINSGAGYSPATSPNDAATGTILNDDTSVSVAVTGDPIVENAAVGTVMTYTFTRSGDNSAPLTINFSAGGTASFTNDYSLASAASGFTFNTGTGTGTLTFAAGSSTATVTAAPTNDTSIEGNETAAIAVDVGAGYGVGTSPATGTITDNDFATLAIASTLGVTEPGGAQNVVVTLTTIADGVAGAGTLQNDLTADVVDAGGGTAGSAADYNAFGTQTVYFKGGSGDGVTQNAALTVLNDSILENNETVNLTLQNISSNGLLGNVNGVATIADNETATLAIVPTPTVTEQGGTQAIDVTLTIVGDFGGTPVIGPGITITADIVDAGGGSATSGLDYTAFGTKTVTFDPGTTSGTTLNVGLGVLNDTLIEGSETVNLRLQNPLPALGGRLTLGNANSAVTITDNDTASLSIAATAGVTEQGGAQTVLVTLTTTADGVAGTGTLASTLTADVVDAGGGTATSGSDYSAFGTQSVSFAAGSADGTTQTVTLTALNDSLLELGETVNLKLQNAASPGTLGNVNSVVTIADNETASIAIVPAKFITESGGAQTIAVTLTVVGDAGGTAQLGAGVSLSADVVDAGTGSAVSGTDYAAFGTQTVTFTGGSLSGATQNVTLTPVNDGPGDSGETVNLTLQNPQPTLGGQVTLGNASSVVTLIEYTGIYVVSPGLAQGNSFGPPKVRVFDPASGNEIFSFLAYEPTLKDSIRVAVGDINNDGFDDVITTTAKGTGRLRVFYFDPATTTFAMPTVGAFSAEIDVFNGIKDKGAFVASGDLNGDGQDDIVVGSALGSGKVKVLDGLNGAAVTFASTALDFFQPFGTKFKGGVRVAVGDINGDGKEDLVAAQGFKGAEVKVFAGMAPLTAIDPNTTIKDFTIMNGTKAFKGGLSVAVGKMDDQGFADLIIGRNTGKPSQVEVFSGTLTNPDGTPQALGTPILPFDADPTKPKFKGGVRVAVTDVNFDGIADIIAGAGPKGGSQVNIYDGVTHALIRPLVAYPLFPNQSVFVAGSS